MLQIKRKDDYTMFKVYLNFRAKTVRICSYFNNKKIQEFKLPYNQKSIQMAFSASYDEISEYIEKDFVSLPNH